MDQGSRESLPDPWNPFRLDTVEVVIYIDLRAPLDRWGFDFISNNNYIRHTDQVMLHEHVAPRT